MNMELTNLASLARCPESSIVLQPVFWYSTIHGSENLNLSPYAFVAALYGINHLPVSKALFIKILCSLTPEDCI